MGKSSFAENAEDADTRHDRRETKLFDIVEFTKDCLCLKDNLKKYLFVNSQRHETCCAVFDIDETLFINKDANDETQDEICVHKFGKMLYNYCLKLKIPCILVTAREGSKSSRKYVMRQLDQMGIRNYERLYMQGKHDTKTSAYKARIRSQLKEEFGSVSINCGDQITDHFSVDDSMEVTLKSIFASTTYYVLINYFDVAMLSIKFPDKI